MTRYEEIQEKLRTSPRRWLVTGVAGFIGSNLLEMLLQLGQEVVGLDNFATGYRRNLDDVRDNVSVDAWSRFTFIEGDIRNCNDCIRACEGVEIVLHQAALGSVPRSIHDPRATNEVNVDGFVNMLASARDAGVKRFVYASSSSVYGDHASPAKIEDKIGLPLSPYAVSKRANELYAKTFFDHYGIETIGLRYFNVFGPRQDPEGAYAAVIPKWISRMLQGESCVINGDGRTSRDFCYVENAVQANLLAALADTEATGGVFNIAVGARTTLNDLWAMLKEGIQRLNPALKIEQPKYVDFRPGDVRHSLANVTLAKEILGYMPTHDARAGLRTAIRWFYVQSMADIAPCTP